MVNLRGRIASRSYWFIRFLVDVLRVLAKARRWEDFVSGVYSKVLPFIVVIASIGWLITSLFQGIYLRIELVGVREAFQLLTYLIVLVLVSFVTYAFYQIALTMDIRDLLVGIRELLYEGVPKSGNLARGERKEERIETSGAWALMGVVIGGVAGLMFGPVGFIAGGIVGGLVGNQLEYEILRVRKERRRRQG